MGWDLTGARVCDPLREVVRGAAAYSAIWGALGMRPGWFG